MEVDLDALIRLSTSRPSVGGSVYRRKHWTVEEESYLQAHLGFQGSDGVALALGRSPAAVRIRQVRRGYPSMGKASGWMNGRQIARLFGTDEHAVRKWFAYGIMTYEYKIGLRGIYRVRVGDVYHWAMQPEHWMCFHVDRISNPALRRLVMMKQALWGDEWWTPGQVAAYHGFVSSGAVNRAIREGRLQGVRWGNWWIRRSDAVRAWEPRNGGMTERGAAFVLRARAQGLGWDAIARLTKQEPRRICHWWNVATKERR